MTNKKTAVGILGGGITGLTTAYALAQKGIESTVYEQRPEVGGAIRSISDNGWLVEEGPNTLMVKSQSVWDLLEELDLSSQMVEANKKSKKRYVVKNGKPVSLPTSLGSFISSPLLSVGAKLRLFKEPWMPQSMKHDESIATFISRRLGKQPLDYAVNPFVSGIYAGDPKELSVKHTFGTLWEMEQEHGSLLKGMFKKERPKQRPKRALISFRDGNQTLPKALAHALPQPVQTSTTVTSVGRQENGWKVQSHSGDNAQTRVHQCLISTLPTYALPEIFASKLFEELSSLPYAPLSVMALGFKKSNIQHPLDGFGMLIPEVENYKTLGALFSSTLFEDRSPKDYQLLTCFIGGDRNPELASEPVEELRDIVTEELTQLLGITGDPVFSYHHYWPRAIPQYKVGFDRYLSIMKEIEKEHRGLYLAGNYRNGVSVPDCLSSGFETAQKVQTFLQSK